MLPRPAAVLAGAVLVAIHAVLLVVFWPFTADDAYIVARYARNLAEGQGLVYHPGERISALTSPVHALLATGAQLAFGAFAVPMKVLGAAATLAAALAGAAHLRRRPAAAVLFLACVLASPFVAVWTVGGLETPYLIAVITAFTLVGLRLGAAPPDPRRLALLSALAGVAFLTRHDSVLFTAPLLLGLAWRERRSTGALAVLAPAAGLAGAWLIFARFYFGDVLPTSAHVKVPGADVRGLRDGLVYEGQFLVLSGLLVLLVPAAVAVAGGGERRRTVARALRERWWIVAGLGLVAAYGTLTALTHMMFSYRLLVPYLPAAALLALALSFPAVAARPAGGSSRAMVWVGGVVVLLQLGLAVAVHTRGLNPSRVGEYQQVSARFYGDEFLPGLSRVARDVRSHWRGQAESVRRPPRVSTFAAGLMPYELGEVYVYEQLVSYRHRCRYDLRRSSDYLHIVWPAFGPRAAQLLPGRPAELVSSRTMRFNGSVQHFEVHFQPGAEPNRLPPSVGGRCLR